MDFFRGTTPLSLYEKSIGKAVGFFFFFFFFLNHYNYTLYKQLNKLKEANTGTKTKHTTTKHKAPDNRRYSCKAP